VREEAQREKKGEEEAKGWKREREGKTTNEV
jgi:hypothetical protein